METQKITEGFYPDSNSGKNDFVTRNNKGTLVVKGIYGEKKIPIEFYSHVEPSPIPDIRNRLQKLYFDRTFLKEGSLKQTSEGDTLFQVKKEIGFLEKGLEKMGIKTFEGWTFSCLNYKK